MKNSKKTKPLFITTGGSVHCQDEFDDLKAVIKKFGAADNRRVCYILKLDKDPQELLSNPENLGGPSTSVESDFMQFFEPYISENSSSISENPSIFETEPKENLDIYYEASQAYPLKLETQDNKKSYLVASVGDRVICSVNASNYPSVSPFTGPSLLNNSVKRWDGNKVTLNSGLLAQTTGGANPNSITDQTVIFAGETLQFHKRDNSFVSYKIQDIVSIQSSGSDFYITEIELEIEPHNIGLSQIE